MVMIEFVRKCSLRYELRFLQTFLRSKKCVFFVRCKLRLEKELRTALFSVTTQHVVAISYQHLGQPIGPISSFGF